MKNNGDPMPKEIYISFRTTPEIKEVLQKMAKEGYRTLSQQCEMIIIEWLKANDQLPKEEE